MGIVCCKFAQEQSVEKHLLTKDAIDELWFNEAPISVQCKENSEGQDGIVLIDTEEFPMINILCFTSVEDLPERQS